MKLQLAVIYKVVKNKIKIDYGPFLLHRKRHSTSSASSSVGSLKLIGFVPLLRTTLPSLHQFHRPSWPLCYSPFWNHELLPAFNVPALGEPRALLLGRPNPRDQVPLLQTEVTVLTLAERACLNLLFRSCMLGDLGLGMREVLRFSGVLLGGCL